MVPTTILPGGSCHIDREASKRVYEEAVLVSGRHLLARVEVAFGNTLDQGVEGIAVHLERGRCRNDIIKKFDTRRGETVQQWR